MTQGTPADPYFEDLAAYALGALDVDARRELEAHIETCPICLAELDELMEASSALAVAAPPVEPPSELRARIMARLDEEDLLQVQESAAAPEPPTPIDSPRRAWRRVGVGYTAMAATLVAAVAVSVGLLLTTSRLGDRVDELEVQVSTEATAVTELALTSTEAEGDVVEIADETRQTVSRLGAANERLQKMLRDEMELSRLRSIETTKTTYFKGTESANEALGTLDTGHQSAKIGILRVYGLPPAPEGYVYQLWLMHGGLRRSIGTFEVDSMGYAWIELPVPASGVEYLLGGVTLEPEGGSPEPTGNKVLDVSAP